jgi:hypothetical protein
MTLVLPSSPFPHLVLQSTCKARPQTYVKHHATTASPSRLEIEVTSTASRRPLRLAGAETITTVLNFGACCVGELAQATPSMPDWPTYVNPQLHFASTYRPVCDPSYWLSSCDCTYQGRYVTNS